MQYRHYVLKDGHYVRSRRRELQHKALIYTGYVVLLLVGTAIGPYTLGYWAWD